MVSADFPALAPGRESVRTGCVSLKDSSFLRRERRVPPPVACFALSSCLSLGSGEGRLWVRPWPRT